MGGWLDQVGIRLSQLSIKLKLKLKLSLATLTFLKMVSFYAKGIFFVMNNQFVQYFPYGKENVHSILGRRNSPIHSGGNRPVHSSQKENDLSL